MDMIKTLSLVSTRKKSELFANLKLIEESKNIPYVARALEGLSLVERVHGLYNSVNDNESYPELEKIYSFMKRIEGIESELDRGISKDMIINETKHKQLETKEEKEVLKKFAFSMGVLVAGTIAIMITHDYEIKPAFDYSLTAITFFCAGATLKYLGKLTHEFEDTPIRDHLISSASHTDKYIQIYRDIKKLKDVLEAVT